MLRNVNHLKGFAIRASDGEIGTVEQFYFDDETWALRYLVVNTGDWLPGRLVLLSPIALRQVEWQSKRLDVALTKKQVEDSPLIDTHKPVSRQHEAVYLGYYGYPYYWGGPNLWGLTSYPAGLAVQREAVTEAEAAQARAGKESADSHLHST
ncbi:MAG: PRC-barrel domain-containing protein, partial [Terriglobia bacterium]